MLLCQHAEGEMEKEGGALCQLASCMVEVGRWQAWWCGPGQHTTCTAGNPRSATRNSHRSASYLRPDLPLNGLQIWVSTMTAGPQVLVIGAGIIGSAVANNLAARGCRWGLQLRV